MGPIELFVLTATYEEASAMYRKTLQTIKDMQNIGEIRYEHGQLDNELMVRVGFRPFRIAFGDRNKLRILNNCVSRRVIKTLPVAEFDPQGFLCNFTSHENKMCGIYTDPTVPINIIIAWPPMDVKVADNVVASSVIRTAIDTINATLRDADISRFVTGYTLAVPNVASIRSIYGADCTNLFSSDYTGEIMTPWGFEKMADNIAQRIIKAYKNLQNAQVNA